MSMSHNDKFYDFSTLQMIVTVIETFYHFSINSMVSNKQTKEKMLDKNKTIPFAITTAYRSTIEREKNQQF